MSEGIRSPAKMKKDVDEKRRVQAAIDLKVPNSGIDWLDDMIIESRRMDASEKASMMLQFGPEEVNRLRVGGNAGHGFNARFCKEFAEKLYPNSDESKR